MRNPFSRRPRPGTIYDGPHCYCSDYGLVERPGFYALTADGKTVDPKLRLVMIDDAPGDVENGACHLEVAAPKDPPQRSATTVELEAHAPGTAEVAS